MKERMRGKRHEKMKMERKKKNVILETNDERIFRYLCSSNSSSRNNTNVKKKKKKQQIN